MFGKWKCLNTRFLWGITALVIAFAVACSSAPTEPAAPQQPAPAAPAPTAVMPAAQPTQAPARPQEVQGAPVAPVATSAPQTTQPSGNVPTGMLVTATNDIRFPMGIPRFNQVQSLHMVMGIVETPFSIARTADGVNYQAEPRLALDFEVAPDFSYADVTIRRGVQFHDNWGEMTAEDVAWSYNDANARINPESVHDTAGDLGAMFLSTEALDEDTVRFGFNVYSSNWAARMMTDFWEGPSIYSKNVFDSLGVEGMRNTMVGTGPLQVVEYTQNKIVHMRANMDYWDDLSYAAEVQILEIPEDASRRAAMETGEIAITNMPVKDWPDLLDKGFKQAPEGFFSELAISFGGNWWVDTEVVNGTPIERTLDLTKPWVGDPNDPARMESARKFRTALGTAIDRDALNQGLLNGSGRVGSAPGWPKDAVGYQESWSWGYDLDESRRLLNEAGYGNGATIDFWVGPSGFSPELGEAIAGIWEAELNIKTNFDKTQYNAAFRPSIINRSVNKMWFCGTDGVNTPNLWPKGFLVSTVSNGGFMCGTEHRKFGETFLKMSRESDPAELQRLSEEFYNELRFTAVQIGVIDTPEFAIYNPNEIESWEMRPVGKGGVGGMRYLWRVNLK